MKKNIKIGCRITSDQHQRLHQIKVDYGFKSTYEILETLLNVFLDKSESVPAPLDNSTSPISEVEKIFQEFADYESPEYSSVPVQRNHHQTMHHIPKVYGKTSTL